MTMADGEQDFSAFEQTVNEPPAADPPAPAPAPEDGDPPAPEDGDPPAPEGEEDAPKPKQKQTAQERFDELTALRRSAERDAKYWRDVAEGRVKPNGGTPPAKEELKAPNPDDYDLGRSDERYIEAIIDYRVKKGLDEVQGNVAQSLQVQAAERAWEAKQDAARSELADYDTVVQAHDPVTGAPKWPCSEVAAEAIRTSDAGPKIAYHLASNPDEARRIAALSPLAQVLEIGKIAASVSTEAKTETKTTNAPKPPGNQARGAGGAFSTSPATEDFAAFEAMANRKAR
jgi:hypothetical protein